MFNQAMTLEALTFVLSSVVGLTFAYAALSKLRDLGAFLIAIGDFPWIPRKLKAWVGSSVIVAELAIAISHIAKVGLEGTVPIGVALIGAFLLFAFASVKREDRVPCLCFGVDNDESIGARTIVRLGALLVVEVTLFILLWSGQVEVSFSVPGALGSLPLAIIVIAIFLWCMAVRDIVQILKKFLLLHAGFRRMRTREAVARKVPTRSL